MIERKYKCDVCLCEESACSPATKLIGFKFDISADALRQVVLLHECERHICLRCLSGMRKLATANAAELNKLFPARQWRFSTDSI